MMNGPRHIALLIGALCVVVSGCSGDKQTDGAAPSLWDAPVTGAAAVEEYPTSLDVFAGKDVILGTVVDVVPGRYADPAAVAAGETTEEEYSTTHLAAVVRVDDVIRGSRFQDAPEVISSINTPTGADGEFLSVDEVKALATTAGPAIWQLVPKGPEGSGWYVTSALFVVEDGRVVTPWDPNLDFYLGADRFSSLEELADALRALPEPTG